MQQSLFQSKATATAKAQAFDRQTLGELYRRANDLMRNVDGLQPQEGFDELLKYISLKESLEKHGISPSREEVSALGELFGKYFHEMGEAAAELWKDRRPHLSEKCLAELHRLFQSLRLSSVPFDL